MWRKGTTFALLVGMQTGAATVGKIMGFSLKKLYVELPFDPAIPLLGIHPKNPQTLIRKNTCTFMFIAVVFTIAKILRQPKCP